MDILARIKFWFTPQPIIMQRKLEDEKRLQYYEAKMSILKNLQLAEYHAGLARIAQETIDRLGD